MGEAGARLEFTHAERIVRPRRGNYVDYGAPRIVLVRRGPRELQWVGGSTVTIGIGLRDYSPSSLVFRPEGDRRDGEELQRGGRCSRALLERHAADLQRLFELPDGSPSIAAEWRPGMTLIIEEGVI